MGALHTAVQQGKALYAGISSYSAAAHRARRRAILRDLGTPLLIHQPSYSLLNRWIERGAARRARRRGRRLHRLLAARAGDAHGQVPRRHPRGLARRARTARSRATCSPTRALAHVRALERDRAGARAVAGADGARVDAARPARHVDADRREQRRAARGERRRARAARRSPTTSSRRSTATPSRRRHQPLGAVERALTVRPRTADRRSA